MWPLGLGLLHVVAFLVVGLTHYWVYRWRNPKCNGRLPPGSMGLPIVGETLQFLTPSESLDIPPFFKTRTMKYGRIFKSSLLGRPVVVSLDPEFNHYILQQEGNLVEMWYMDSFAKLFDMGRDGESMSVNSTGRVHRAIRNLVLSQVGIKVLREGILPHIQEACKRALMEWSTRDSLNVKKAITSAVFDFTAKHLYDFESKKNIGEKFGYLMQGVMSVPLNIPGTAFHKCMKIRKMGLKLMKDIIDKRRAMPDKSRGDFLDKLLDEMKRESFWSDDLATCLMLGVLFASFETISTALTVAIMLLTEHPTVVKELEREHKDILRKRERTEGGLTWNEYKSMNFTMQVVNETLRISSNGVGILRRVVKDIKVNGYTIPEGWTLVVFTASVHLNPEVYKDPLSFNAWRWKELPPDVVAKNFIPFGGGMRMCAGADLAKAFMAVFLHVLVSNYR